MAKNKHPYAILFIMMIVLVAMLIIIALVLLGINALSDDKPSPYEKTLTNYCL